MAASGLDTELFGDCAGLVVVGEFLDEEGTVEGEDGAGVADVGYVEGGVVEGGGEQARSGVVGYQVLRLGVRVFFELAFGAFYCVF